MYRVTKCCCCISIKTGAYIIGVFHVIGLLLGILLVSPLQISLEVFCGCTFLYMIYRDREQNRLLYFTAYCVYAAMLATIRMVFVFWDHDEKQIIRSYCKQIEEKVVLADVKPNGWEATEYKDMNDCKEQVGHTVMRDEFISLLLSILLQVHFALVLYAHYKNAHLVKSKGGCQDDAPDIQLGNVVPNTDTSGDGGRRVQHAVDDEDLRHS